MKRHLLEVFSKRSQQKRVRSSISTSGGCVMLLDLGPNSATEHNQDSSKIPATTKLKLMEAFPSLPVYALVQPAVNGQTFTLGFEMLYSCKAWPLGEKCIKNTRSPRRMYFEALGRCLGEIMQMFLLSATSHKFFLDLFQGRTIPQLALGWRHMT